ncbi:MAG TPA: hypothetical protein VG318_10965 [Actinomycetota bacterium]|nr:hypothetical protein [Actinomycetota bacterium]
MRNRGLRVATACLIVAATGLMAPAASAAEAAPPCEVMLPPDVCEQYYYGTLTLVGNVYVTVTQTADDVVEVASTEADGVIDVLRCTVWNDCP